MTARATARASASSAAPETWQVISVVAPSPSAACWRASSRATASIARPSSRASRDPAPRPAPRPAAPDASRNTVSFVLVSPSTLSWSHVRAAAGRSSAVERAPGSTVASVRTIESIVAIRGWIIPTPFAIPVTRIGRTARPSGSGRAIVDVAALVRVSVVRSASAAAARPASRRGQRRRDQRRDPGRDPVERQARADDPGREEQRLLARRSRARRRGAPRRRPGRRRPPAPVAAFAQPLVEMTAGRPAVAAAAGADRSGASGPATGGPARPRTRSG